MSFFITLPSFPRPSFEDNTPASFKVRLPNRLSLEGSGWKVGLASITIPNISFLHQLEKAGIENDNWLMSIVFKTGKTGQNYKLKRVYASLGDLKMHSHSFLSGVDFFTMISHIIDERRYQLLDPGYKVEPEDWVPLKFSTQGDDHQLHVGDDGNETSNSLVLKVDSRLAKMMLWTSYDANGDITRFLNHHLVPHFRHNTAPETTEITGNVLFKELPSEKAIQLTRKVQWRFTHLNRIFDHATKRHKRTLYVYSNVGASTIVGDQVVSLLREVDYDPRQAQTDQFHFEPNMIQYHDVLSSDMEILEVQITEIDNTLLDFGQGTTTVVLHFKKE